MSFGLRYFENGKEVRLVQVSGGGRVQVSSAGRDWWMNPRGHAWEVFEASVSDPQTYGSRDLAEQVADNLSR